MEQRRAMRPDAQTVHRAVDTRSDDDEEDAQVDLTTTAGERTPDAAPAVEEDGDATGAESRRQEEERRQAAARNEATAQRMGGKVALRDAKAAQRRIMRDLRSLQQTLASAASESLGLSAHPIGGDIFHWRAIIAGPEGTAWEGGLFKLDLHFGETYPLEPPHVRFLTKDVFHPNVYVDGNICLDTLKSCWSPMLDVEALLLSITSLLSDPNPTSAANGAAARMLVENRPLYEERVRKVAEQSLEQSFSDVDGDDDDDDEEDEKDNGGDAR